MGLRANSLRLATAIFCATVLTASAYFAASGLHRVWWPVWAAPIPVLLLAPRLRAWQAVAVALAARSIAAALNFWHYVHDVVQFPLWLTLATVLVPGALFALAVALYRELLRGRNPWLAAFAFPVTIASGEYLFSLWQGTFFSTGYTQLENLPILQIAAIAGLAGITFSVNFLASGLAAIVSGPVKLRFGMAVALGAFYLCIASYGGMRLHNTPQGSALVRVGLVETHAGQAMFPPDAPSAMMMFHAYAEEIKTLADKGAQFVILPEMTSLIPDSYSSKIDEFFQATARAAHVQILVGILHVTDHRAYNEGRLYSAAGEIETVYRKHHLVPTWESRSTPGTDISVLSQPVGKIGIEICRDMDYPELSRRYGHQQVGLMLVPAWDQGADVDAVWHGHLSLIRGVESGFAMVRDAKNGLLTASDDRGRILEERSTRQDGAFVTMLATVPVSHDSTLYQEWGDWFAWLNLAALASLLAYCLANWKFRGRQPSEPELNRRVSVTVSSAK